MIAHLSAPLLLGAGMAWLMVLIGAALLLRTTATQRRLRRRIAYAAGAPAAESVPRGPGLRGLLLTALTTLGRTISNSGLLPARTLTELNQTLAGSGFRGSDGLFLFIGAKLAGLVGCPLLAFFALPHAGMRPIIRIALIAAAGGVGLLGPDTILRRIRTRYIARLQKQVPDALDLLVICAQAGLGLEAAIERVADEMQYTHREIARELGVASHELQISADTRQALIGLGRRTGLDSLKRLATTLVQSLQYGTPLSTALRTLSAEMRQEILTRFEERAARLPVLLTVPMIVFILPCFFIVVAGPAALTIGQAFGHMGH